MLWTTVPDLFYMLSFIVRIRIVLLRATRPHLFFLKALLKIRSGLIRRTAGRAQPSTCLTPRETSAENNYILVCSSRGRTDDADTRLQCGDHPPQARPNRTVPATLNAVRLQVRAFTWFVSYCCECVLRTCCAWELSCTLHTTHIN